MRCVELFRQVVLLTVAVIHIPISMLFVDSFSCNEGLHFLVRPLTGSSRRQSPPLKWPRDIVTSTSVHASKLLIQQLQRSYYLQKAKEIGTRLFGYIINDEDDENMDEEIVRALDNLNPLEEEETLLQISLMVPTTAINTGDVIHDAYSDHHSQDVAIEAVSNFCAAFPFAAILPVQPLQHFPIQLDSDDDDDDDDDNNNISGRRRCIEVQFLRKKTPERGSVDGGIRFYIQPHLEAEDENTSDTDDDVYDRNGNNINLNHMRSLIIDLIAKRNSQGQVITKVFAEKLIITNFVAHFLGTNLDTTGTIPSSSNRSTLNVQLRHPSPIVHNIVELQSIYHKWM